ncbi:DUF3473 domain-containing protein [Alteromonas sediminis]|uniref:DUF3473 domain-containing protein n=1 Tax=Alteromonas sediminis TaxID=2259342 RepID=A0A3N5Y021_9ALTE|nr:XrtA system polysaccharide deacetylase [Alteromonas sediminis]RPJ65736.1 DUF3473 domain-containing protein [Alteromonas sediminis]
MPKLLDSRLNAMTVDVEDYFQVSAFDNVLSQKDWDASELRVDRNTHKLLDLFAEHEVKSTFFTLAWVAQKCPDVIRRIVDEGHELASHGLAHQRINTMNKQQVKEDIFTSKAILEDIGGVQIVGYRAPSFSINGSNEWAYDILVDAGFTYSSSTYPIEHDLYGVPDWPRFKYTRPEGIIEIPIPTIVKQSKNIGIGGGGYFRLYPYWLSKRRIDTFMRTESEPYSFYFHPWEIDPDQPKVQGASFRSNVRHYINLKKMEGKLIRLLKDYQWGTMKDAYGIKT